MITKDQAINIALNAMPRGNYIIENVILKERVWYIGLRDAQVGKGFEVEINAETGKIIGGGGGK